MLYIYAKTHTETMFLKKRITRTRIPAKPDTEHGAGPAKRDM
jgi:hypothetical protein